MTTHEFVTSSELAFGDIMINFCDPEFAKFESLSTQIYRLVAYGLFANRMIIPSRYLLQPGVTFDAVSTLSILMENGLLVPDLREGYSSFVEYLEDKSPTNLDPDKRKCAQFLDDHAQLVYSFDISGQSELYHKRLMDDISELGLLRNKLDPDNVMGPNFERAMDEFADQKGSRRTFVRILASHFPGHGNTIQEWAALRYYITPAELEPRCFRDFPAKISAEMRQYKLSVPMHFTDPDLHGQLPEPMHAAYSVLINLPIDLSPKDLALLSNIVCRVRHQVPKGPAKFSTLSSKGFRDNIGEVNQVFREAVQQERKLADALKCFSSIASTIASKASWLLGVSLDQDVPAMPVELGLGVLTKLAESEIRKTACPFIETSNKLESRLNNRKLRF